MGEYDSDLRQSEFNELAFKMQRVHRLQDKLNFLWQNPKGTWTNPEDGTCEYGFVLILAAIRSLYMEVRPKCTQEEKNKNDNYYESLQTYIEKEKLFVKKQTYNKIQNVMDENNWNLLRKNIHIWELLVRDLLDNHGFSPDNQDDGL